jgi:hypothetical protein
MTDSGAQVGGVTVLGFICGRDEGYNLEIWAHRSDWRPNNPNYRF